MKVLLLFALSLSSYAAITTRTTTKLTIQTKVKSAISKHTACKSG